MAMEGEWRKVSNPAARDWRGRNRKKAARTLKNNGEGTNFAKELQQQDNLGILMNYYLECNMLGWPGPV